MILSHAYLLCSCVIRELNSSNSACPNFCKKEIKWGVLTSSVPPVLGVLSHKEYSIIEMNSRCAQLLTDFSKKTNE